jgi:hypothetical protein
MMLEGIKILGERIVNMPELYDPNENRVVEVKMTDPEIPTSHQVDQLIQLVCENGDGIFTDEEVKYIKDSIVECRRRVFNSWVVGIIADQDLILPRTRHQMKAELEHEEEERKWRMELEKQKRQEQREKQLAMEQMEQRAMQDAKFRYGTAINKNSLTGGLF